MSTTVDTRRRACGHRGLVHSPRLRRGRATREDRRYSSLSRRHGITQKRTRARALARNRDAVGPQGDIGCWQAAMLWVGGSIVIHSLHTLHLSWPYELTTSIASTVTGEGASAAVSWLVTAFLDAVFGFLLGSILIPIVNVLFVPIGVLFPRND